MLKVKDLVPNIYYDESRDFQIFGRSFEVVYNYLKTNVDLVSSNPTDARSSDLMIRLVTKTLGFETKHEYDLDNLRVICSVFMRCLKMKGTVVAIEDAIQALLNVQNIEAGFNVAIDETDHCLLNIYLPINIRDVVLLEDLFDYILPAGMLYNFIYGDYGQENKTSDTFVSSDDVAFTEIGDINLGTVLDGTNIPPRTNYSNVQSTNKPAQTYTGAVSTPNLDEE